MRNHNKAILLRVTEGQYWQIKADADQRALSVQEYLRDLLRYGKLPDSDGKNRQRKPLTPR